MKQRSNLMRQLSDTSWGWRPFEVRTIYIAILRSLSEYAAPAWAPWASKITIEKLERTQSDAVRTITGQSDLLSVTMFFMKLSSQHYLFDFSWPALGKLTMGSTSLPKTTGECYCKRTVQDGSKEMFGETLPPQLYLPLTSHQRTRNIYIFLIFRGHYPLSHLSTSPTFQSPHPLSNNSPLQRKLLRLRAQLTCNSLLMDPPSMVWRMEKPEWSSLEGTD